MGDKWWSAELKSRLAEALHAQGRREEALDLLETAEAEGVPGNYRYEVAWRTARAKLLAADGKTTEASQLAGEAADIVASTGNIAMHADALVELADVLAADAQDAEAAAALERAAALYDEKEYTWCADQARRRLGALTAPHP
jgi:tetratricopeptide (TPR) repeat protein